MPQTEKTAMMQLRNKLLIEVQELKETAQQNEHLKGYREALKNVANDIDAQMLAIEKQHHEKTYNAGYLDLNLTFEEFYNNTFNQQ